MPDVANHRSGTMGEQRMSQDQEPALDDKDAQGHQQPKADPEFAKVNRDLGGAIERLGVGEPLVLNEGVIVSDGGILIMSQYVDVGMEKLRHRPETLVKFIESKYGLEHAPDIQLSAPPRFRDYGETFIQDHQEGRARRETKTERPARSFEEHNREQERAFSFLGQEGMTVKNTETPNVHTDTQSMTYGGSSWIFCTSIGGTRAERHAQRAKLSGKYDHETVIRQPGKFALALGEMYADQMGPQSKHGHFTHAGGIRSLHRNQLVLHGPICYTDDVFGFLDSRQFGPLSTMYPLFVKHSEYRHQGEYRFVVHCENPVGAETLHLQITGTMRDALAPAGAVGPVTFEPLEGAEADASRLKVSPPSPTHKTMTRTRNKASKHTRTLRIGGQVAQEEIITSEQSIVLTTKLPRDGADLDGSSADDPTSGKGELTEMETRERRIEGTVTDKTTDWRTRIFTIADTSGADEIFTLEERDHVAELLQAVGRPFAGLSGLPQRATEALKDLARQTSNVDSEFEVQIMSACWNSIWAICNLQECFGDIVASVRIVQDEFVAITLTGSADPGAAGKILVGPRGTFAYVLTRGDKQIPGHGGAENRLVFFPDEQARAAFEEFGWSPLEDEHPIVEE